MNNESILLIFLRKTLGTYVFERYVFAAADVYPVLDISSQMRDSMHF